MLHMKGFLHVFQAFLLFVCSILEEEGRSVYSQFVKTFSYSNSMIVIS